MPHPRADGPGALQLRFHREGEPLQGVQVQVLPAGEAAPTEGVPVLDADAEGVVECLLPAGRYRWRLISQHSVILEPPRQDQVFELGFDNKLSGPFEITPGETLVLSIEAGAASVRGLVQAPDGSPATGAQVRLLHQFISPRPDGDFDEGLHSERDGTTDEQGRFRFDDVRPSDPSPFAAGERTQKLIWLRWQQGNEVFLAREVFQLDQATAKDMVIQLLRGPSLTVRFAFHEDGLPRAVDELFETVPKPLLMVSRTDSAALHEEVFEHMAVPADAATVFHGLPPGAYDVRGDEPYGQWPTRPGCRVASRDPLQQVRYPDTTDVPLAYAVETGCVLVSLELPLPEGFLNQLTIWLIRDQAVVGHTVAMSAAPRCEASFMVRPGPYRVCVSNNRGDGFGDGSYWAEAAIQVAPEGSRHRILIGTGQTISGTLLGRDGLPARERGLTFADASGALEFEARTDSLGQFTAKGLPPGWPLYYRGQPLSQGVVLKSQ